MVKLVFANDVEARSFLSKNFHDLIMDGGGSPSPVFDTKMMAKD